jgi:hypothetical protein
MRYVKFVPISMIARQVRRAGMAIGLALPIALLLTELVLCIFHCQVWLPLTSAQTHHAHHAHHAQMHASSGSGGAKGKAEVRHPPASACAFRRLASHTDAGFHIPPSPVRDALPPGALLLLAPLLALGCIAARCLAYVSLERSPLLRPPNATL